MYNPSQMTERLDANQKNTMNQVSKAMEEAWRIYCHPQDYSFEQLQSALEFILKNREDFTTAIQLDLAIDPETFERIFTGIYHHPEIQEPLEIKYKYFSN